MVAVPFAQDQCAYPVALEATYRVRCTAHSSCKGVQFNMSQVKQCLSLLEAQEYTLNPVRLFFKGPCP